MNTVPTAVDEQGSIVVYRRVLESSDLVVESSLTVAKADILGQRGHRYLVLRGLHGHATAWLNTGACDSIRKCADSRGKPLTQLIGGGRISAISTVHEVHVTGRLN